MDSPAAPKNKKSPQRPESSLDTSIGKGLIIVPVFNEETNIRDVIDGLLKEAPALAIVVVNDGSHDNTKEILASLNVNTINLPFNLGYGAALQTGFKYALANDFDFVVIFDGDGQHDPGEISKLLIEKNAKSADIVIGSRFMGRGTYNPGLARTLGMGLFKRLTMLSTGEKITDITSGFQAIDKRAFAYYTGDHNFPLDFPDADVIINMKLLGFKIVEVPVKMHSREDGASMHSGLNGLFYMAKMLVSIFFILLRSKSGTNK